MYQSVAEEIAVAGHKAVVFDEPLSMELPYVVLSLLVQKGNERKGAQARNRGGPSDYQSVMVSVRERKQPAYRAVYRQPRKAS